MKAYKVEIFVVDHDNLGADGIISVIENTRYPNRCIFPDVKKITGREIGDWDDDHPLNTDQSEFEYKRLFGDV